MKSFNSKKSLLCFLPLTKNSWDAFVVLIRTNVYILQKFFANSLPIFGLPQVSFFFSFCSLSPSSFALLPYPPPSSSLLLHQDSLGRKGNSSTKSFISIWVYIGIFLGGLGGKVEGNKGFGFGRRGHPSHLELPIII